MRIFAAAALIAAMGAPALAQDRAGEVTKTQQDAYQATSSIGYQVAVYDDVFTNARVYTKQYGTMEVRFDDGTDLLVAPNASIVIDEYVYAGQGRAGSLALSLARGAVRVVSGRMEKASYNVKTPVASIGVRGTTYWLNADNPELLEIWVDDGVVVASPNGSDQQFEFAAPVYATCSVTSCAIGDAPPKPATYPLDPTGNGRGEQEGHEDDLEGGISPL